jgi:SARP family transcriptional regulator, regulator of embCAB operon
MRYEILGALRVVDKEGSHPITSRKLGVLLAALLINSDLVLTVGQLTTELWGDNAPRRATATLQVHVSQLRKFLSRTGRSDSPIVTCPSGYLLHVGTDELDLRTFTGFVREGRGWSKAREHEKARGAFEAALGLCRGPALGDLRGGPIASQFIRWLDEARLECVELLMESNLALGHHREIVGELYSLAAMYPFRETFHRQLMLALYRSERQADALKVYESARLTLAGELGLEPCQGLRDLQSAILRGR